MSNVTVKNVNNIRTPETYRLNHDGDNMSHVVECATICYASFPENYQRVYDNLIKRGHLSMLRHASYYYRIPTRELGAYYQQYFRTSPYCHIYKGPNKFFYIVLNGQFVHENQELIEKSKINNYKVDESAFHYNQDTKRLIRLTFVIKTQIAITRELNRVSPNNIAERSTRFIDHLRKLGVRFSRPHWLTNLNFYRKTVANALMSISSASYRIARSRYGLNLKPEDARYFLPLGTESEVAYTYTIAEWENIVEKRYHDTTGRAHPDCKTAVKPIHDYIHEFLSNDEA